MRPSSNVTTLLMKSRATSDAISGHLPHRGIVDGQDVGHHIGQQTDRLVADHHDDDDMPRLRFGGSEPQSRRKIHDGDDGATEVHYPLHVVLCMGQHGRGVQPRISRTTPMSMQKSCSATLNDTTSRRPGASWALF
jgi:hypothetical protein